jgi:hypothetical protein
VPERTSPCEFHHTSAVAARDPTCAVMPTTKNYPDARIVLRAARFYLMQQQAPLGHLHAFLLVAQPLQPALEQWEQLTVSPPFRPSRSRTAAA